MQSFANSIFIKSVFGICAIITVFCVLYFYKLVVEFPSFLQFILAFFVVFMNILRNFFVYLLFGIRCSFGCAAFLSVIPATVSSLSFGGTGEALKMVLQRSKLGISLGKSTQTIFVEKLCSIVGIFLVASSSILLNFKGSHVNILIFLSLGLLGLMSCLTIRFKVSVLTGLFVAALGSSFGFLSLTVNTFPSVPPEVAGILMVCYSVGLPIGGAGFVEFFAVILNRMISSDVLTDIIVNASGLWGSLLIVRVAVSLTLLASIKKLGYKIGKDQNV